MTYLILGVVATVIFFFVIPYLRRKRKEERILKLQSNWINSKEEDFDFPKISYYSNVVEDLEFHKLSDQTIEDLDLHELFKFIDRTTSRIGQQYLFKKLLHPTDKTEHHAESLIRLFATNQKLREEVQLDLSQLNIRQAYNIPALLNENLLEKPKWFNLLWVDIGIVISLIILSFKFPVALMVMIIPFAVNMLLHLWNKNNTFQFSSSIPQLNLLIKVCRTVLTKDESLFNPKVEESITNLKSFQRKAALIKFSSDQGMGDEFTQLGNYFIDLFKAFFLVEIFTLFRALKELEHKKDSVRTLFDYAGNIDSAISIASLRSGSLKTCQPNFISAAKEISVKKIYHPLINDCIKNDLSINGKSVLITGSNMSGKSTFLRTLILNSILAQTINTCFADEFVTPILKQHSSIKINDNLFEGVSYYFQEVHVVGSLIREVESPRQNLFILDEVFKGTNTVERIAAAKAILSYLNRNDNIVIVSTHDIELAEMLTNEYDLYHFTETIENDKLIFDHKVKSGQLKTRNAIKLLELSNYPEDIIKEARLISSLSAKVQP